MSIMEQLFLYYGYIWMEKVACELKRIFLLPYWYLYYCWIYCFNLCSYCSYLLVDLLIYEKYLDCFGNLASTAYDRYLFGIFTLTLFDWIQSVICPPELECRVFFIYFSTFPNCGVSVSSGTKYYKFYFVAILYVHIQFFNYTHLLHNLVNVLKMVLDEEFSWWPSHLHKMPENPLQSPLFCFLHKPKISGQIDRETHLNYSLNCIVNKFRWK